MLIVEMIGVVSESIYFMNDFEVIAIVFNLRLELKHAIVTVFLEE